MSIELTEADMEAINRISAAVPGWSVPAHYLFFKVLLHERPDLKSLGIFGVYHGRDIAFLNDILDRHFPGREVSIVGVDRFTDERCDDWDATSKTWAEAASAVPPSFDAACKNTRSPRVTLFAMPDEEFLRTTDRRFDCFYFDTDHTDVTVCRQCKQAPRVALPGAIIAGDDYADTATWGVKRAVTACFKSHDLFAGWIWVSTLENLKP